MSIDTDTGRYLVRSESSTLELVAGGLSVLSVGTVVFGFLLLFEFVAVERPIAGVAVPTVVGGALSVLAVGIFGVGIGSYTGVFATEPSDSGGLVVGVVFGLLGVLVGGLLGAQTLGLSTLWPLVALLVGGGTFAAATLLREDLGSTVPAGAFVLATGIAILSGTVSLGWSWNPAALSATFTGTVVVPGLAVIVGLLAAWTTAKAHGGFGTRGRQQGAYILVGANAAGMLSLLVLVVAFVVVRGFQPMTEGIRWGLFWGPITWFYVPPLGEYVIVDGPILWFYWPFVMEGFTLGPAINGVLPAIVGTVWLVVGAIIFAVPLGVGAAVFLTEYAEQGRFTRLIEVSTNGLWSTPSIVYGLFGLAFLVPRLGNTNSILAGQFVLGFMLLPLVVITSREALKSVPDEYRDASAALGVGKWETIKSVVVPAAMPGIITGIILGVGRIAGETAPILLVTSGSPFPSRAPAVLGSFQFTATPPFVSNPELLQASSALPYQLFAVITAGVGENISFAWGTALVLLLVVLSFYAIGIVSRIYFRRRLHQ
jgi:phosphate transport system permease protein